MDKLVKWLLIIGVVIVVLFIALPVIIIGIASMVFVIQPTEIGSNTCSTTSGILITNHKVDSSTDSISLNLSNLTSENLSNVDLAVDGTIGGTSISGANTISSLGTTRQTENISLLPAFNTSESYSLTVKFSYIDRDGLSRTVTSTCNGKAS